MADVPQPPAPPPPPAGDDGTPPPPSTAAVALPGDGSLPPRADGEVAETLAVLGRTEDPRFRVAARTVVPRVAGAAAAHPARLRGREWKVCGVAPRVAAPPGRRGRRLLAGALTDTAPRLPAGDGGAARDPARLHRRAGGPDDIFSPSSPETIDRLERVASRMNVHVHRISPGELRKLPEYDALFIRTLTGVSEQAFQFALRAEALDMPTVDDSQSIIRCGNKVFLEELLRREGIPTPRSRIITPHTAWEQVAALGFPFVVKLPDGSFSNAVHKVVSEADFHLRAGEMFRRSPLILAQEWLPTDFDWRVTVLGGKLLFAARYFMARGHWQIRSAEKGTERYGRVEAIPREQTPRAVADAALRAAALIGDGLYGVDLKETPKGPVVIEVNDNPNLDVGYEDAADGNRVYEDIVEYFVGRIEAAPAAPGAKPGPAPEQALAEIRAPIRVRGGAPAGRPFRPFEVAGMELEYPVVDRDLNVVPLVEKAFRVLAGRGTSDVELGAVGFSNEIADHVLEVKTSAPVRSLAAAEAALVEGIGRFTAVLRDEWGARLLPTGMHPWFNPANGRLWERSNGRIYNTYARLFDIRTHGWMNVHAMHLNLPMGSDADAVAMHTAASLLIPYLPALAASSPMHDGELQPAADSRLAWILEHQARIPKAAASWCRSTWGAWPSTGSTSSSRCTPRSTASRRGRHPPRLLQRARRRLQVQPAAHGGAGAGHAGVRADGRGGGRLRARHPPLPRRARPGGADHPSAAPAPGGRLPRHDPPREPRHGQRAALPRRARRGRPDRRARRAPPPPGARAPRGEPRRGAVPGPRRADDRDGEPFRADPRRAGPRRRSRRRALHRGGAADLHRADGLPGSERAVGAAGPVARCD
jgi:glutathione synthase/RimK-type ligase-like ATP-grasp enzyme